jgi:hypothetical protein
MGFNLVWIAVQEIGKEDFLADAGFEDTGEPDAWLEADHSGGEVAGGWYVVVSGDFELIEADNMEAWSAGGRLVAAVVSEGAMNALAMEWRDGKQVWSVYHDGSEGGDTLNVEGQLPPAFEPIRARLMAAQTREQGPVDHVFDIPLELAEAVTGFRHDRVSEEDGFTVLEPV